MSEFDNADDGTDDDLDNGEQQATEPLVFRIERFAEPAATEAEIALPILPGEVAAETAAEPIAAAADEPAEDAAADESAIDTAVDESADDAVPDTGDVSDPDVEPSSHSIPGLADPQPEATPQDPLITFEAPPPGTRSPDLALDEHEASLAATPPPTDAHDDEPTTAQEAVGGGRPQSARRALTGVALAVFAALAIATPIMASPIFVTDVTQLAALTLTFAGLWLLTHRLGLLSVGHGALTGCGAVAALHSVNDFGFPPSLMPIVGFVAGFAVGALLAIPALRLPKAYLALLTLSAAVVFPIVLRQIDGPLPVTLDAEFLPPAWTGVDARDEHIWEFWYVVIWVVVVMWLLHRLLSGPVGRAIIATRDDPTAAAAFGVSVYRLRLTGVALSSGLAGIAGGLLVVPVNFTDQAQYPEELSIKLFALTIAFASTAIGGSGLLRTVPASAVLVLLPVWLVDREGWVTEAGWSGLVKSEYFFYAALLLVAAYVRSYRTRGLRAGV